MNQFDNANAGKKSNAKSTSQIPDDFLKGLHFNDTTKQMEALKAMIFNASDLNETRLQFIKDEIETGRYQIQSSKIAEKLTEHTPKTTREVDLVETD